MCLIFVPALSIHGMVRYVLHGRSAMFGEKDVVFEQQVNVWHGCVTACAPSAQMDHVLDVVVVALAAMCRV